ncbi:DNA polymerase I [Neoehrlichia mikurensis]|uniref:DNA polymerase I n=1 Tax=Neoehrlichia mikurensis TaxID=89586 RepID=A0A9Q9C1A6_9RICK|nr:DNA polymerase I [Neoehrlichia mikurensis]QXK92282.1 DNA polymerase I [Neoehrlichia mikurensis]QXK92736.1 DNA polymerase I [Neoehrlichia mikurensis]QXK93977.1 DNA polymerase I [Neoehrlichia mikurensis]UTO55860.1 DNA polymerase I [Neoehrlichia mikurensis]UTO56775.1 DNA polymerase I [Neoehrlichia mikurensis]
MQQNFTIIDAYGFLFRAYYVLPNFRTSYGLPIGGMYGFINILIKYLSLYTADYLVVVFDTGCKNFRHTIYPKYKINRPALPDDLIQQFSLVREAVDVLNIAHEEVKNYEADDIIATLSKKYVAKDMHVNVVTSDKDMLQLLGENTTIFDPIKSKYLSEEYVYEKFGVASNQLLDLLALTGDASDNIPGVPGIGVKTAAKLLNKFGSLDNIIVNVNEIEQNKCREALIQYYDQAILSRQLVSLCYDVDLSGDIEKYAVKQPDIKRLMPFLEKYELKALTHKIAKCFQIHIDFSVRDSVIMQRYCSDQFENFIDICKSEGILAIYVDIENGTIRNITVSYNENNLFCIDSDNVENALNIIAPILMLDSVLKVVYDAKHLLKIFHNIKPFDDIMIMSYSIDAGNHDHSLRNIVYYNLNKEYTNLSSQTLLLLHKVLKKKLLTNKLCTIYERFEKPLINILHNMQQIGVLVNAEVLHRLSKNFLQSIKILEQEIYQLAGENFNLASPKQLGNVLFDKMNIGKAKKLRSGIYSTNADVLEEFSINGVEIAEKVLRWRHFTKLKNTYVDVLLREVRGSTGRVHTFFSMISTITGRISSSNPNLQNIPVRSEEGNEIRRAFIAREGHKIISADYSQIELRIMAHIGNVKAFKNAFFHNEDIHLITARQIFNTDQLDKNLRRKAKSINFGIIYGMKSSGLARQLKITKEEAALYINQYFSYYPEIKTYIEEIKNYARTYGYTKTIFGRKCFIRDINSSNYIIRGFAERAAVNAPLQGTAADIIKRAMIHLFDKLKTTTGRILLQVHDELLIEVPDLYVDEVARLTKEVMETVVVLSVPLKLDISIGNNWADMKKLDL